jgi:hypothetical protein
LKRSRMITTTSPTAAFDIWSIFCEPSTSARLPSQWRKNNTDWYAFATLSSDGSAAPSPWGLELAVCKTMQIGSEPNSNMASFEFRRTSPVSNKFFWNTSQFVRSTLSAECRGRQRQNLNDHLMTLRFVISANFHISIKLMSNSFFLCALMPASLHDSCPHIFIHIRLAPSLCSLLVCLRDWFQGASLSVGQSANAGSNWRFCEWERRSDLD